MEVESSSQPAPKQIQKPVAQRPAYHNVDDGGAWKNTMLENKFFMERVEKDLQAQDRHNPENGIAVRTVKSYATFCLSKGYDTDETSHNWFTRETMLAYLRKEQDYAKQAFILACLNDEEIKRMAGYMPSTLTQLAEIVPQRVRHSNRGFLDTGVKFFFADLYGPRSSSDVRLKTFGVDTM